MDGGWSYEQKTLISELIQGMDFAKQLRVHLTSAPSTETRDMLMQGILSSYEKALLILKWSGPMPQSQPVAAVSGIPESPLSVNGSPQSDDFEKGIGDQLQNRDISKKRKMMPKWTDQVRISPENGLEGPHDDGYSWRKYGQKDILGARYPRSYYRCTYRNTQNCWATKQVQRSDEDPTVFEITYRGTHTCGNPGPSVPAPVSPEKQEQKQINHQNNQQQQQQSQEMLSKFRAELSVDTNNLDSNEMAYRPFSFPSASVRLLQIEHCNSSTLANVNSSLFGSFSSPFLSPSTPESNYFSMHQANDIGQAHNVQHLESDPTEIISTNTSSTNSPIMDLDFSLDQVGIDPNFPFDTSFFP
ncbi:probable WRKY transcription factor 53 [Rhodamnia argentea]|uniref:Probable WRKY transcription factor 53 n=1 Tax=Rhodamnia argentea TaxID=178133 RepID=A0A8B8QR14_9MYRT|nr:probable WRKY transcription factor 53 [Rhodamnia argentea]